MSDPARVVVPYVEGMLRAETLAAVEAAGYGYEAVPLDEAHPAAYGALLARLWRRREPFVILEQDMVPEPGQLARMVGCGHDWCGFSYYCGDSLIRGSFGLVRFGHRPMFDHPTLAAQAGRVAGDPHRPTPWWSLAETMTAKMLIVGYEWHCHGGPVAHLHGRGAY